MNTRDPFNLRRTGAFPILQSGARIAARSAAQLRDQVVSVTNATSSTFSPEPSTIPRSNRGTARENQKASLHVRTTPDSIPEHEMASQSSADAYPTGQPSQQDQSSQQWRHARRHANSWAGYGQKVMDTLSPSKEKGLPMYKDKPFGHGTSGGKSPAWRRQRVVLAGLLILGVMVYWFGLFSPSPPDSQASPGTIKKGGSTHKGKGPVNVLPGLSKGKADWDARREAVRDAFKLSWAAYEKHAWGYDEFHPVTKTAKQMVPNGMGWTIVDALDTMMIMNLTTQLSHAREWIHTSLNYEQDHDVNTFETTIRMLGGLLSAHYLSTTFPTWAAVGNADSTGGEDLYLEKAVDLAGRLLGAYESASGIPFASVNLKTRAGIPSHDDNGASSTAEAATLQLEMKYLSSLTGDKAYWEVAEKVIGVIDDNAREDGLVPIFIYAETGKFKGDNIRLGSRGDSYYEYLIKQYLQTSYEEPIYKQLWDESLTGIQKHLITYSKLANLTILAERPQGLEGAIFPKMDHLVCFMPGTIALAVTGGQTLAEARQDPSWGQRQEDEMELARQLTKTCWGMYKVTATGLSPEIAHFRIHEPPLMMADGIPHSPELDDRETTKWHMDYEIHPADTHNVQRPETIESLFYMWRITQDVTYREWAWQMFESFIAHTAVENGGGYSSINHVDKIPSPLRDNMESFWLAETLKYFYLTFGPDDVLPLSDIVLNTEAHPMPRFGLGRLFKTGWQRKPRPRTATKSEA